MRLALLNLIRLLSFFALSSIFLFGQQTGRISSVSITSDNMVRMVIDAPAAGGQLVDKLVANLVDNIAQIPATTS